MRSLSVQQKRRFDAKGTHLERHGIEDRADNRKRITGPGVELEVSNGAKVYVGSAICKHLDQSMVALVETSGSRGRVLCPHIPSQRFFSVGNVRSRPKSASGK